MKRLVLYSVVKMYRIFHLLCFQPFGSEKPPAGETEKYTCVTAEGAAEDKGSKVLKAEPFSASCF